MLYVEMNYLKSTANYVFCTYSHCSSNSVEYMFFVDQAQRYFLKERDRREILMLLQIVPPQLLNLTTKISGFLLLVIDVF